MKYTIAESRLVKLMDNYITRRIGNLYMRNSSNINATAKDFELVDIDRNIIFEMIDGYLGVSQELFFSIMFMFNMNYTETENMFVRWFEKRYPNIHIVASYCSIYY
jgi:hypothetical protein